MKVIGTTKLLAIFILAALVASLSLQVFAQQHKPHWKNRQQRMFAYFEKEALNKNWQKETLKINGLNRKLLWKAPDKSWKHGAIIVLHGGGGTYSNFSANLPLGKPMVNFADLALSNGFAVFSPDSTNGIVTGINGHSAGKRWDSLARDDRANIDLPFIKQIIEKTIPGLRPTGSSENIYITGISNGGYMTILVATNYPDLVAGFAPVSCGDPYGTYMECDANPGKRPYAPGVFKDRDTHTMVSYKDAANSEKIKNEIKWPQIEVEPLPPFKQFQHEGDRLVDLSNMKKANALLKKHGYPDDGAMILPSNGRKKLRSHFWMDEYNQPIIEFFIKSSK